MKKHGFTLIEMAITLTIIGLIVGGSLKAVKSMREKSKIYEAKENVIAAKNAIIGAALENSYLPNQSEFSKNLSPVKGNQAIMLYSPDSDLVNDDICTYTSTKLIVIDNSPNEINPSVPARTIDNVAFVVASAGANYNMQTATINGTPRVVNIHASFIQTDDNTTPIDKQSDEYDDVVDWVTLSQLKSSIQCKDSLRLITNNIPLLDINISKSVPIYTDDDTPTSYTWQAKIAENITSASYIRVKCNGALQPLKLDSYYRNHSCSSFMLDIYFGDSEQANRVDINVSDNYGNSDIRSYSVSLK
ncbi:type II secretion system protein [Candidatus Sulfurimonas baltica]|uniref:Prepilin-type N-terminal cleavage/methylation domain-containing protein n=1 Tax=Candidatus Sulfurimonas baltica TaxID=2740404 RepID=A0A7S7LY75_9BACT|nr:prepilin-type N-terminal cleavage/methylation domain-containing protein [Candidatus Sulfurimonas baltica]QOY53058.1 prepilin-type N-terminal cleavage/methylation domain-containing protein [Candidatus Sulfurimonas baltica]